MELKSKNSCIHFHFHFHFHFLAFLVLKDSVKIDYNGSMARFLESLKSVSYRLVIINCAILSYLGVHPRGCGSWRGRRRGWGGGMHPRSPLWHKKGSVCPPQFDAVTCHASTNSGGWLLFKLQFGKFEIFRKNFQKNSFSRQWITDVLAWWHYKNVVFCNISGGIR